MGRRQDGRIEPGQKLAKAISARAWNRAQDAADIVLGQQGGLTLGEPSGFDRAPNIVLVRSGPDAPRFGILGIDGVVINPNTSTSSQQAFAQKPVLTGRTPRAFSDRDSFVVCLEPIPAGKIGRAIVSGVFACKVKRNDAAHRYATVIDDDNTKLQTTTCGLVQLLWVGPKSPEGEFHWAVGVM